MNKKPKIMILTTLAFFSSVVFLLLANLYYSQAQEYSILTELSQTSTEIKGRLTVWAFPQVDITQNYIWLEILDANNGFIESFAMSPSSSTGSYDYTWDSSQYPDDIYTLQIRSYSNTPTDSTTIYSEPITIQTRNHTVSNLYTHFINPLKDQELIGLEQIKTESNLENTQIKFTLSYYNNPVKTIDSVSNGFFNTAELDTTLLDNGQYTITANANANGINTQTSVTVLVNNPEYSISINDPLSGDQLEGVILLKALSSPYEAKEVIFNISDGTNNIVLPATLDHSYDSWVAEFDTSQVENGSYIINAKALFYESDLHAIDRVDVSIANTVDETSGISDQPSGTIINDNTTNTDPSQSNTTDSTNTTDDSSSTNTSNTDISTDSSNTSTTTQESNTTKEEPSVNFLSHDTTIYYSTDISVETNQTPTSLLFIVKDKNGNVVQETRGFEYTKNHYRLVFDVENLEYGNFRIIARANFSDYVVNNYTGLKYERDPNLLEEDMTSQESTEDVLEEILTEDIGYKVDDEVSPQVEPETVDPPTTEQTNTSESTSIADSENNEARNDTQLATDQEAVSQTQETDETMIDSTASNSVGDEDTTEADSQTDESEGSQEIPEEVITNIEVSESNHTINQEEETKINALCNENSIFDTRDCQTFLALPRICQYRGLFPKSKCDTFLSISSECRQAGITERGACEKYLQTLALPDICKQNQIDTQVACRAFIISESLPTVCKEADISDKEGCDNLLQAQNNQPFQIAPACVRIGLNETEKCQAYLNQRQLDPKCREVMINDAEKCQNYLNNIYSDLFCEDANIVDQEECRAYLSNKIKNESECLSTDTWNCDNTIEKNMGKILSTQSKFEKLDSLITENENISNIDQLITRLADKSDIVPITNKETRIAFLGAKKKIVIDDDVVITSPYVIIIDSDQDGLSDDIEKIIGSDVDNTDSDGDGYDDYTEYKNGYNPIGEGKINKKPAPIVEAILNKASLEHPKASKRLDDSLSIEKIDYNNKTIEGKAEPNTVYTLFVYSNLPVLTTVKTDEYGNWIYIFKDSMMDGEHEAYLTLNDDTGKVVKRSNPLSFFIQEAQAVSAEDFVATSIVKTKSKSDNMLIVYLLVSLTSISAGIITFILYFKYYKKRLSE